MAPREVSHLAGHASEEPDVLVPAFPVYCDLLRVAPAPTPRPRRSTASKSYRAGSSRLRRPAGHVLPGPLGCDDFLYRFESTTLSSPVATRCTKVANSSGTRTVTDMVDQFGPSNRDASAGPLGHLARLLRQRATPAGRPDTQSVGQGQLRLDACSSCPGDLTPPFLAEPVEPSLSVDPAETECVLCAPTDVQILVIARGQQK